jgi:ParB family transcriptional regulator, chromosome partitioning protein
MDVMGKRRALGRGLGALIPAAYPPADAPGETLVPLAAIQPNPLQPRQTFAEDGIDELAESIRQKGILQPLLVRRVSGGYELIAGERRLRAAQRAGLEHVPITVRDIPNDGELLEIALIENIQRENLNPLEEARAYRRLNDEFHLTQDEIAQRVGKDRSTVANTLRLLQLPSQIQRDIERGVLSAGHARALVTAGSDTAKIKLAHEVVTRRLSVRQTERLAKQNGDALADTEQRAVEERLTEALGTRVRLVPRRDGSGRLEIEYYSLDGLNGLLDRLTASIAT